jgi:hypothetical protein
MHIWRSFAGRYAGVSPNIILESLKSSIKLNQGPAKVSVVFRLGPASLTVLLTVA